MILFVAVSVSVSVCSIREWETVFGSLSQWKLVTKYLAGRLPRNSTVRFNGKYFPCQPFVTI